MSLAGHDIVTGAYTVVAITAADRLGLSIHRVEVRMDDSTPPPASLAAGSRHTATITHAVTWACNAVIRRLADAAVASNGPLAGQKAEALRLTNGRLGALFGPNEPLEDAVRRVTGGAVEIHAEHVPEGLPPESVDKLYSGKLAMLRGHQRQDIHAYAYGAQFVEVRVHRLTCEIRVLRMAGAFAAGTIVNPLTALSQYMGGMIWGLGAALEERTEIDLAHARYVNDNLSEYPVPVNADV
nr:molybdopterin cofactor-binding domain-containing protein [Rubellimicrobium mesophilum]